MARTAHGDRNRAHALAAVGAAFVTATNRPAIYEATLVAAVELAGPDYVVVLWELGEDGDELPLVAASIAAEPARHSGSATSTSRSGTSSWQATPSTRTSGS